MPTYNAYTKTNDYPISSDVWEKVLGTYRAPRLGLTATIKDPNSPYFGKSEFMAVAIEKNKLFNAWVQKYNIPQSVIDEWNRQALANASTEEQKSWWQKVADKVTNTVNNFVQQAGNVLQSAGESALLAPLLPFKKAMVNALRRKGEDVSMSSKLLDVASLFKQKIVERKSTTNYLEHADIDAEQIMEMVKTILPFFTQILELVKSGKATQEEKLINDDAEEEAKKATEGGAPTTTGVNSPESGDFFKKNKFLIIGVVAVVLFLAFRKK